MGPHGRRRRGATAVLALALLAVGFSPAPAQAAPRPPVLLGSFGDNDGGSANLSGARHLAVGPDGDLFVVDVGHDRVVRFTAGGEFLDAWGTEGAGDGEFNSPYSLDIGADGLVYVAETYPGSRVQVFEPDGTFVRRFGDTGTGDGRLVQPHAVAIGPDGNVYVGEYNGAALKVYAPDGTFLERVPLPPHAGNSSSPDALAFGPAGDLYLATSGNHLLHYDPAGDLVGAIGGRGSSPPLQFDDPQDLDVGPDGHVFVADRDNRRVVELAPDGTFLRVRGTPGPADGQINYPYGVEVGAGGDLYVAEYSRIQRFAGDGALLGAWGTYTGDGRLHAPAAVALGPLGEVYVADTGNSEVQVFTAEGEFLRRWGAPGSGHGQLAGPEGIDVSADGDVYVADTGNDRVQVFNADGSFERAWGALGTGPAQLDGPRGIAVAGSEVHVVDTGNERVQVFDPTGGLLRTLGGSGTQPGQFQDPRGVAVAPTGEVVVTDDSHQTVNVFAADGTFVRRWVLQGRHPYGVAVDAGGTIHLTETLGIRQYALDGTLLLSWGGDEPLSAAEDIEVGPTGLQYVADAAGDRIVRYGPPAPAEVAATLVADELDVLPGDAIHYHLTVRNVGDVPLTEVVVSDEVAPDCAGPLADLAPGGSATVDCTRVTDEGDLGRVVNVATVDAAEIEPTASNEVSVDVSRDLRPVLVRTWRSSPTSLTDGDPTAVDDIDVDDAGRVLVAGERSAWPSFAGAHRFDATGTFLDRFVEPEDRAGRRIRGIATGPDGSVYAAACQTFSASDFVPISGIVERYQPTGSFAESWLSPGNHFTVGECAPNDVTVAPDGTVYASNRQMDQVQRLESGGFRPFYGGRGAGPRQLDQPGELAVSSDGTIYLTDVSNRRVHHVGPDGALLGYVGTEGTGNGQFGLASGVDVDGDGRVYVSESGRLQVFSPDGRFLGRWDRRVEAVHTDLHGNLHLYVEGTGDQIEDHVVPSGPYARVTLLAEVRSAALGATIEYHATVENVGAVPLTGVSLRAEGVAGCARVLPDLAPGASRTVSCPHPTTTADVGRLRARVVVDVEETAQGFPSNWTDTEVTPGEVVRWGGSGSEPGHFAGARGLAVAGDVYVADCGNDRVQRFTPSGTLLGAWGTTGSGAGQLRCPVDVAADGATVLVLDQQNRRVQRFTPEGAFVAAWDVGTGLAAGLLPTSVAVTDEHEVVVTIGDRVRRFGPDGTALAEWGAPSGRGIHAAADGHLSLSTDNARSLSIRSRSGVALAGLARTSVADVTEDGDGFVYLADPTQDVVAKLSPGLELLGEWPVTDPESLAVDGQGQVYVVAGDEVIAFGGRPAAGPDGLRGTVTDRTTQAPVGGALVGVLDPADFSLVASTVADAGGHFSVDVAEGRYFLYVLDPNGGHQARFYGRAQGIEVVGGRPTGVDVGLVASTGAITGTVRAAASGAPLDGAWAVALDAATGRPERGAVADGSGRYRIEGLVPGPHVVVFVDPSGAHAPAPFTAAGAAPAPVAVTGGAPATADGTLAAQHRAPSTSTLAGAVVSDVGGADLGGISVLVVGAADLRLLGAARTGPDGQFLVGVPAGSYRLLFLDHSGGHAAEWFDDQPVDHAAGSTAVAAPATVAVGLRPTRGSVTGVVTTEDSGASVAGAWVAAIGARGVAASAVTGPGGSYVITAMPAGTYRFTFVDPSSGRQEYHDGRPTHDTADPVTVPGGGVETVDASLAAAPP